MKQPWDTDRNEDCLVALRRTLDETARVLGCDPPVDIDPTPTIDLGPAEPPPYRAEAR
jgi:hypothetical protein